MNTTTYPIKPIKVEKLTLTDDVTELSTKSQPCMMYVVSGKVYLAGKRDAAADSNSYPLSAGDELRFCGEVKLCSDSTGADVRLLYYDVV